MRIRESQCSVSIFNYIFAKPSAVAFLLYLFSCSFAVNTVLRYGLCPYLKTNNKENTNNGIHDAIMHAYVLYWRVYKMYGLAIDFGPLKLATCVARRCFVRSAFEGANVGAPANERGKKKVKLLKICMCSVAYRQIPEVLQYTSLLVKSPHEHLLVRSVETCNGTEMTKFLSKSN